MDVMNWLVSKAFGVSTLDKNCCDKVLVFLTKRNISEPNFSFLRAEKSFTYQRFYQRVYFGTGIRNSANVAYLLNVNEDIPRPNGALVDATLLVGVKKMHSNWLALPDYVRGSFYDFALCELGGGLEALDGISTGA
jgi:hypothetical protein